MFSGMEEVARVVICRQNAVGKACKREITKMLREWKIWPRAQQVMGVEPRTLYMTGKHSATK